MRVAPAIYSWKTPAQKVLSEVGMYQRRELYAIKCIGDGGHRQICHNDAFVK